MSELDTTVRNTTETPLETHDTGFGRVKLAFLYVLIAGLAASAITAIIALLIGEFNSAISNALLTILVFFSHSLFILALVWSDRYNTLGKAIIPTVLGVLVVASMITTTLGVWEIISNELAWRFFGLYFLILGFTFIIVGILKLRINHKVVKNTLLATAGLLAVLAVVLVPWVLDLFSPLDPLYFRIVGALAILASTTFLIALIVRGIVVAKRPGVRLVEVSSRPLSAGMLSIAITLGVITAIVWCVGFTAFLVSAVESSNPPSRSYNDSYTFNN